MDVNNETVNFINAVETERWDIVASHLETILNEISHDHVSLICEEDKKTLALWFKILINSKMYLKNEKGALLTKRIILKFWNDSTLDKKWDIFLSLISLYDIKLYAGNDKDSIEKIFASIHKKTGITQKELAQLFLWKSSYNILNIVRHDGSIQ